MAHTHPQPEWSPAETADTTPPREKNASLVLLWVIALLAVVAAGVAWYKQRQPASLPLESAAPPVTAPAVVPDDEATAAASRTDKPRAEQRRSVASAERAPRSQGPRLMTGNPSPQYPAAALRAGIGGTIHPGTLQGGHIDSHGDHRIAMSFAVAGQRSGGEVRVGDIANVATSFPGFDTLATGAGFALRPA